MLNRSQVVFVFVDVQGRLAEVMVDREELFDNLLRLALGLRALEVPIVVTEQMPEKLGSTREEFAAALADAPCITKSTFSCGAAEGFMEAIAAHRPDAIIVAGIEAHVCVYQTVCDLLDAGYQVLVVADAVSSRRASNRDFALQRMRDLGGQLVTTEMILMELLADARHPAFREVHKLIR